MTITVSINLNYSKLLRPTEEERRIRYITEKVEEQGYHISKEEEAIRRQR